MSEKFTIENYEILNDIVLFKWKDKFESYLNTEILRKKCPCANCEGEKDVFGNIYKSEPKTMSESSFLLNGIQPVGYYALRPYWKDGHHSGIYSFEMLRTLCENLIGE